MEVAISTEVFIWHNSILWITGEKGLLILVYQIWGCDPAILIKYLGNGGEREELQMATLGE